MPSKHMRARGIFRLEAATLDPGDRDGCDREDGGGKHQALGGLTWAETQSGLR